MWTWEQLADTLCVEVEISICYITTNIRPSADEIESLSSSFCVACNDPYLVPPPPHPISSLTLRLQTAFDVRGWESR